MTDEAAGRRERALTVGALFVGSVLALITGDESQSTVEGTALPSSAGDGLAASRALAFVVVAGAGALLLGRGRLRNALGGLLAIVGVGLVWVGAPLTMAGGVLVVAAGVVTLLRAGRWPAPGPRYTAPAEGRDGGGKDVWDSLDRGEDPTL